MPASTEFPGGQVAEHTSAEDLLKKFSFDELARAARFFSDNRSLGVGDFGDVYKGILESGELVAIKKLKCKQDGEQKEELENQIKEVGSVSHPNLVKLVGYCCEEADRLLVLEFVPNKSLKFHLSDEEKRSKLKWSIRMGIALGSAKGLAYLHEQCNPKIIHRDIKSDNILLDSDFKSKVADFGLAKIFPEINIRHIPADKKEATIYTDPEISDEKSDIYSFGVILLELISGRRIYESDLDIVNWAKPLMTKGDSINVDYENLVDSTLKEDYDQIEMEPIIYCAAASLYSPSPKLRPTMGQIVRTLEGKMPHKELWVVEGTQSASNDDYIAYELKTYTYSELAHATKSFTQGRQLGNGGFGSVYWGFLLGKKVAIKKLNHQDSGQDQEEFEKEVNAVGIVRHGNLVKLVGYCNEDSNRLLVLEFVTNKSLRYHLNDEQRRSNLKWSERMKIAKGSAKGLAYLHEEYNSKIIHRDIKAENILLDENCKPKIADFGLAKFFPITNSVTHISSHWKGTYVYADPENYYTQQGESIQQLSEKSDVYSFGVVLLELISGRKINDEHQVDIVKWAKPLMIKGDSVEINYSSLVDSTLKRHYHKKELEIMIYCAAASVYRPAKRRPRMKQIVEALEGNMSPSELWAVEDVKFISRKLNETELEPPSLLKKFDFRFLAEAAGDFSGKHLLRQHGLCPVYKGVLPGSDQRKVAIKRLMYEFSQQNKQEFEKEIMAISNVNHRNIVNLIGYCSDEEDNRLLVFEFVANNSLKFHLHENGGSTIEWTRRMEIAKGAARGLKYMHEDSGHKILHLYVKSDNILFDDKFIPKLAEFGSAKIFPDSLTHFSIKEIMQNSGYMAPEYQSTSKLTDKLDIYSFGVILLELITGKQPAGHFSGHKNMVKWAKPLLSQSLLEGKDKFDFVDEKLQEYNTEQMDRMIACVLACVDDDPQRRPRMSQILDVLEGNKSLEETILFLNLNIR